MAATGHSYSKLHYLPASVSSTEKRDKNAYLRGWLYVKRIYKPQLVQRSAQSVLNPVRRWP